MVKINKWVTIAAILSLVLPLLILLVPAHIAEATALPSDVWVATTGNDSYPGTQAQPFATIQKGIDDVAYNGTVHVAAGTYHENLSIDDAQDLVGSGAPNTIIDGGGLSSVLHISSAPSENCISGFTIQNGNIISASLWNPTNARVLFAGINLDFIKTLPRLFIFGSIGGGIYIDSTHIVTLNDCVIKDNQAERGGGIYNGGKLYMNRCTVSGNTAVNLGGGIFNDEITPGTGQMWLTNCTISGNSATNGGGGIYNDQNATMTSEYSTIANNQATNVFSQGGGFNNVGQATFESTIVANNTAAIPGTNNCYNGPAAVITSLGHNLDSENSCGFNQPSDKINTNPLLSPLQDNGGPTFTHALLHGSPAIDAADNAGAPATDQRGIPRPQGTICDIGAYELVQAYVTTATGTGTASFSTLNGYITGLTALAESELDCPPNGALGFPNGLFSFTVTDITPGSTATIVIMLPSNAPTNTQYWKCINGQWVDATSILGSNDGDSVLTLTITDGGPFDADGQANGTIVDPGGPAVPQVAAAPQPRVSVRNPASMAVQYMVISPKQVYANQSVTITTNVVNTGGEAGSLNVVLKINGNIEQTKPVTVGPQGTQPVKFTVTKAQPGIYTVDIGGQKGSFAILGAGSSTKSASSSDRMIAILIIIGAVVLAIVLLVWLLIRRPA